jgi:hypothetical protein
MLAKNYMTWIEVADTAIKVGLGALVSGFTAYLIARHAHKRDASLEHLRRRLDVMHSIVDEATEFMKMNLDYWTKLANWLDEEDQEKKFKDKQSVIDAGGVMSDSFHRITVCYNRFYLIGSSECRNALRALAEHCQKFYRDYHVESKNITLESMAKQRQAIIKFRDEFFDALENTYFKANLGYFSKVPERDK